MASPDPFPAMSMAEAKRRLGACFGKGAVSWDRPFGPVCIQFPSANGWTHTRQFTWRQAKYLAAARPTARESIISGHYPVDWPTD